MEEKKPFLRRMEKSFKLIVTAPLEAKIRYLCSMFPNKEYSGTLFYTYKGSLKKGDIVIYAKDFYLQDIGNATYTEFKNDATLVTYMIDNDLLDCCTGIMHSHNTMSTFFSGTDIGTLESEGADNNHFVSLIVNNKGEYNAMMTAKTTEKIAGKMLSKHHTFNGTNFKTSRNYESSYTVIEAYKLDITVEGRPFTESLNSRIKAINDSKVANVAKMANAYVDNKYAPLGVSLHDDSYYPVISYPKKVEKPEKPEKLEKKEPVQLQLFEDDADDFSNVHCDKKVIEETIVQIITGDVFSPHKKIDLDIWKKNMEKIYEKRFGNRMLGNFPVWELWVEYMFEFLEGAFDDPTLNMDEGTAKLIWANDVINELVQIPKNKYIDKYIELFSELLV